MFRSSVLVVLLVLSVPLSARAAIYPVTVTTGTGAGSLYAVMNAAADGDTIVFQVPLPAVIDVSAGWFPTKQLTLSGPGQDLTLRFGFALPDAFVVNKNVVNLSIAFSPGNRGLIAGNVLFDHVNINATGANGQQQSAVFTSSTVTIRDSHVHDGTTGVYTMGDLTIERSTFAGLYTGVYATNTTLGALSTTRITSSTFANVTRDVAAVKTALQVDGSTLIGASGIEQQGAATVAIASSIVRSVTGTFTSGGFNVFGLAGMSSHPDDRVWLGLPGAALSDNGGPTPTWLPPGDASLLDAGLCALQGVNIKIDQRGLPRPSGAGCEIGAVEIQVPVVTYDELKGAVDTRASQVTVDALGVKVASIGSGVTSLDAKVAAIDPTLVQMQGSLTGLAANVGVLQAQVSMIDTSGLAVVGTLPAAIASRASQSSVDALDSRLSSIEGQLHDNGPLRLLIEAQLVQAGRVAAYYLPASEGGHLEDVRAIVEDLLARTQARRLAGPRLIRSAIADLARGDQLAAAGDVKGAYDAYAEAYRALVR